ncbi:hypothetical protein BJ138DRAFT_977676, partial [Hygrophoropsis aurantiaca]
DVVCAVNVQHNCADSHCVDTSYTPLHQERLMTSQTKPIVKHHSTPHHILNAFSIHNYNHIHSVIPEHLRESPQRVADVDQIRKLAVEQLQHKK